MVELKLKSEKGEQDVAVTMNGSNFDCMAEVALLLADVIDHISAKAGLDKSLIYSSISIADTLIEARKERESDEE